MPTRKVPLRATSRLDLASRIQPRPIAPKAQVQVEAAAETLAPATLAAATSGTGRITWLGDMLTPDRNSLGFMRLILALAVLVSHSVFLTTGNGALEPLYRWTNYTLGQHGVQVFFFLSGILVAQSLYQSRSVRDYITARALRVFPALIVCVLATALILGPWLSLLPATQYLKDMGVAAYIVKTVSLISGSAQLPELFHNNPVAHVVNTSVWTLKYEVMCYAILAAIGWVAIKTNRWREVSALAIAVWLAAVLYKPTGLELHGGAKSSLEVLRYFTIFFGAGAAAFVLRRFIPVHWAVVVPLGAMFAAAIGGRFQEFAAALFLGYLALWLSSFRFGPMRTFSNGNDYSYATYLFHMPVAQALLHFWPDMHVVPLILATTGIVIWLAFVSWELIERPALNLRHRLWKTEPHSAEAAFDTAMKAAKAGSVATANVVEPAAPSKEVAAKAAQSARAAERLIREMAAQAAAKAAAAQDAAAAAVAAVAPPVASATAPVAVDAAPTAPVVAQTVPAASVMKTEPGIAKVWRPMPTVKKLKIHADEAMDAATVAAPVRAAVAPVDQKVASPTAATFAAPSVPTAAPTAAPASRLSKSFAMMKQAATKTPAPAPEPEEPRPRVSASRIAFAMKRPAAADAAPVISVAPEPPPSEPTRAVVAVPDATEDIVGTRSRVAQPRPTWSRPLGPNGPLPA